jgi:hypothetical protein
VKSAADYKSAEEILRDPELDGTGAGYKRGKLIDEFHRLHPEQPVPPPTPTADEARQLRDIEKSLTAARDEWFLLDARENKFSGWLPAAAEQLRKLEAETPPDATAEAVDELNRLARRVQLARTFDGNVGSVRQVINGRVAGAFFALNKLVSKFSVERFPRQFLLAGTSPTNAITDALAAIEALLK